MKAKFCKTGLLALLFILPLNLFAQDSDLENTLKVLSEDAARSYLNPISSAYGCNLNSGWFHRAPDAEKLGLDVEIGIVAMGTFFNDDNTHFSNEGQFRFNETEARKLAESASQSQEIQDALVEKILEQDFTVQISGATIIGEEDDFVTISFPESDFDVQGNTVTIDAQDVKLEVAGFKELADAKMLPLGAPQLSIGTIFGTQATFRWLPETQLNEDLGSFKYFGFGLQHNPAVWLPIGLPVNFAASFYTQKLEIGDLFETSATAFGLNVSKELGLVAINLTPYAGVMFETSKMRVRYDMIYSEDADPIPIDFEIEGENKARAVVGLGIRLLLINLNIDYNMGQYNALSAGLSIRL